MAGEMNLGILLRSLQPQLRPEPYVFCCVPEADVGLLHAAFAIVREDEGVTLILPTHVALQYQLVAEAHWACITLMVHSALEAVGMLAAISSCLAKAGISANPVAGYYHDHVFVQWQRRHAAVVAIQQLSEAYREPQK